MKINETRLVNISELEANLLFDPYSVGNFIGISDQINQCWTLAIYLGKYNNIFYGKLLQGQGDINLLVLGVEIIDTFDFKSSAKNKNIS
jgi:hypothetical protein